MNTIVLSATTSKLQILLAGAPSTECPYTAHYGVAGASSFTEAESDGTTNGTTAVDAVAAPGAGQRHIIRELTVYNPNATTVTLTVQYNNNGTARIIWKGSVGALGTWTLSGGVIPSNVQPADGWVDAGESWSYASATTITVPSDATTKYAKGDKIRIKQGAGYKYFSVITVAATLLTVTGGTDYTVANSAITDNYFSKVVSPVGFPDWFNYTPTLSWTATGAPAGSPTVSNKFKVEGSAVTVNIFQYGFTAGTGVTGLTITTPVTASPINQSGGFGYITNANVQNLTYAQVSSTLFYLFCASVAGERFQFAGTYSY